MSAPYEYSLREAFADNSRGATPNICSHPETCKKLLNEENPNGSFHHYGCECGDCVYQYWRLKQ